MTSTDKIRADLTKQGLLRENASVRDDESLFDTGVMDSLRLMELVANLEREYGFNVPPEDLIPENFESLENIAGYVTRKTASSVQPG